MLCVKNILCKPFSTCRGKLATLPFTYGQFGISSIVEIFRKYSKYSENIGILRIFEIERFYLCRVFETCGIFVKVRIYEMMQIFEMFTISSHLNDWATCKKDCLKNLTILSV